MKQIYTKLMALLLACLLACSLGVAASAVAVEGDVNGDGACTVLDVLLVLQSVLHDRQDEGRDVNGDGKVSLADVIRTLKLTVTTDAPTVGTPESGSTNVTVENGTLKEAVSLNGENVSAAVPAGVAVEAGATALTLSVTAMDNTNGNITPGDTETAVSYDVHIDGVAETNTVPIVVDLGAILPVGQNLGTVSLYHVENGTAVKMTQVMSLADLDAHNEFYYYPATGTVFVALATFSEIAIVNDTENKWEGEFDYSWYTNATAPLSENDPDYVIANADQLAAFGAIVGGMNGQTQDSFEGKTVKLLANINLGDKESENNPDLIFYPIGYYNSEGTYEKTGTDISSGFKTFEGTFDGAGHTVSNFYQNTWEMKGDHDWYDATLQYYRDGMGLFGKVYGGTVKNLTVDNFSSDGEIATTGVIAAYADYGATFENIAITNCNPRVYNIGNGGIVGCVGWYTAGETADKVTFTNITVDNSNKISALWGSYDVACGGIVGQYYPTSGQSSAGSLANAGIAFTNCHVAAVMDVYNDVCANYQYYAYRYTGMMIGSIRENLPADANGHVYPNMNGITATGCTVHFGDWNDYYYCELVANSLASYTHDHQMSRLDQVASVDVENKKVTSLDGETTDIPASGRVNYVVVKAKDTNGMWIHGDGHDYAECYHFVNGVQHLHDVADTDNPNPTETVNGVEGVLKEDKQLVYREFNQLFTGYGWGVTSKGLTDYEGVENMDIKHTENEESVEKFTGKVTELANNKEYKLGDIFTFVDKGVKLVPDALTVAVTNLDESNPVSAKTVYDTENWENGTLTLTGTGEIQITIQDYYFCKPTTITVNVTERAAVEKFETKFTGDFLYRVGNQNAVSVGSLFAAKDGVTINNAGVYVTVDPVDDTINVSGTFTANTSDWTKGTIQFSGTGPVKVTIQDYDYCTPTVLYLEVVDATNATTATSATANNVVLLNNTSGTFSVSGDYTFYGNGFTVTLPTTYQSKYSAGFVGYVNISGGNLDNVRIDGPVYPEMYIYRDQAQDSTDTTKANYFYNSVIVTGGNVTISNCYISGSRTALCLRGGNNVVIENTTLSGGAYANMQIAGGSNVTLRDLTTVQVDAEDSYGKGKSAHGLGIAVDSAVVKLSIEGELNQYNWLNETQWNSIVPSIYQNVFPDFFGADTFSKYWHYLNGGTDPYVNLAFIFACNWDTTNISDTRTTVDYETCDATIAGVAGGVYSKVITVGGNAITDANLNDPGYASPGFNPVAPVFTFDNTANNDEDDENDAADTYCVYDEASGTLKIGVTSDSKTLNLSGISVTKNGTTLAHTAYLNETQINGNSVTIQSADGAKQTMTFKATSNDVGYDKEGNPINGSIEYTWTVTVEIATLAYPAPVWNMGDDYQFDTSNCYYAYYSTSQGYGEAVPIYEGIKVNYYNKSGTLVELDLSGTTTLPTGSDNSNSNAFTYTLEDESTLTMNFSSGWKSGATTHQFTNYKNMVYIYPQSLDNDNYVRAKTTNQNFDVKITYTFTDPNGQSTGAQTMQWYNDAASNGSVSTEQWKTFDSTNGKEPSICVTPDTLVTLADGTQKRIDETTSEDTFLVWDFFNGKYTAAPASIIDNHGYNTVNVVSVNFANGATVNTINGHGFFDAELNKFVLLDENNVADYIGHTFLVQSEDSFAETVLESYSIEEQYTEVWSILTAEHYNCVLEGMLTLTAAQVDNSPAYLMPFAIGDDMKYDAEAMAADIAEYGLYTYEEFADLITYEQFAALNLQYFKVSVGKGAITYDEILYLLDLHMTSKN